MAKSGACADFFVFFHRKCCEIRKILKNIHFPQNACSGLKQCKINRLSENSPFLFSLRSLGANRGPSIYIRSTCEGGVQLASLLQREIGQVNAALGVWHPVKGAADDLDGLSAAGGLGAPLHMAEQLVKSRESA